MLKHKLKRFLAFMCALVLVIGSVSIGSVLTEVDSTAADTVDTVTPVYLSGFKNVTLSSLNSAKNLTGTQFLNEIQVDGYKNDTGASGYEEIIGYLSNMQKDTNANFDKTLVSMWVNFKEAKGSAVRIEMAGNGSGADGIWFFANNNNNFAIQIRTKDASTRTAFLPVSVTDLERTTGEFLLQLSLEYANSTTNDANTDLTIGVYVNGKLCSNVVEKDFWESDGKIHFLDVPDTTFGRAFKLCSNGAESSTPGTTCTLKSCVPENNNLTRLTWSDFVDKDGVSAEDKTYTSTAEEINSYVLNSDSIQQLASTEFETDVKFHNAGATSEGRCWFYYGGQSGDTGMRFKAVASGKLCMEVYHENGQCPNFGFANPYMYFDPAIAGVNTFLNETVRMKITTEYADYDGDGDANDAQLGFYFNGKLYNNQYCYVMDYTTAVNSNNEALAGNYVGIYTANDFSVSVTTAGVADAKFADFKKVTLSSFNTKKDGSGTQLADQIVLDGKNAAGEYAAETLTGYLTNMQKDTDISFDKTLLSVWVDYETVAMAGTRIEMAGADNGSDAGIWLTANQEGRWVLHVRQESGDFKTKAIRCDAVGMTNSTDKFLLQISFEYGTLDEISNTRDIRIGVYVNGQMFNDSEILFEDVPNGILGRKFELYTDRSSDSVQKGVTVESYVPENKALTPLTWADFVNTEGASAAKQTFTSTAETMNAYKFSRETIQQLAFTSFESYITFSNAGTDSRLYYGGRDGYTGMRFEAANNGKLYLKTYHGSNQCPDFGFAEDYMVFDPSVAGINTFLNEMFKMKITTEYGDFDGDGTADDAQFGFYFGDKLYNNQYCYVMNYSTSMNSNNQVLAGNHIGFLTKNDSIISTKGPDDEEPVLEQLNGNLKKITFSHFNVKDGKYTGTGGESYQVDRKTKLDLADTVFCGKLKFEQGKKYIIEYAAQDDKNKLRMTVEANGNWRVAWYTGATYYNNEWGYTGKGTVATGDWLDIMISTELVAADEDGVKNDIKFGLWIDGVLYTDEYYLVKDKAEELGNRIRISSVEKDASFEVESIADLVEPVNPEDIVTLNESFKKITFDHFTVEDGTYTNDGSGSLRYSGRARLSLDKTVFSGDVFIPEGESSSIIFGGKNAWHGLRFTFNVNKINDRLNIGWYGEEGAEYLATTITSMKAQTKMVGEWLNIKVSTEIIDYDKDGQKNDIRIAVWFNDIPYNEEYLIVRDKADELGSYMGIVAEKGCSISVRSIPELIEPFDFAMFGLTEEWQETLLNTGLEAKIEAGGSRTAAPPTGDDVNIAVPICGITISVVGYLAYVLLAKRKNTRNN